MDVYILVENSHYNLHCNNQLYAMRNCKKINSVHTQSSKFHLQPLDVFMDLKIYHTSVIIFQ